MASLRSIGSRLNSAPSRQLSTATRWPKVAANGVLRVRAPQGVDQEVNEGCI